MRVVQVEEGSDNAGAGGEVIRMKIITSTVLSGATAASTITSSSTGAKIDTTIEIVAASVHDPVAGTEKPKQDLVLRVTCGDGSVFGIVELQPPGKKPMDVRSYVNGLRGKRLEWVAADGNQTDQQQHK